MDKAASPSTKRWSFIPENLAIPQSPDVPSNSEDQLSEERPIKVLPSHICHLEGRLVGLSCPRNPKIIPDTLAKVANKEKMQPQTRKKLSFATFQTYNACKGYCYPVSQACIDATNDAGYDIHPRERVVVHPPPASELQWTVATPSIIFGTVNAPATSCAMN
jgi:hypothetical protein